MVTMIEAKQGNLHLEAPCPPRYWLYNHRLMLTISFSKTARAIH